MIGDGQWEIGFARETDDPFPPNDSDETWHVHEPPISVEIPELGGAFTSPWGTGIRCNGCIKPKPQHGGGKTIHWSGLTRLKNHREAGTTALGMEREIIETARAEGRLDKIDRAR